MRENQILGFAFIFGFIFLIGGLQAVLSGGSGISRRRRRSSRSWAWRSLPSPASSPGR
ncbi:hypothetical protein [Methanoculleus chikugoensis]|uniref:hypothetical protein n=1 Tax=Methanoculleus chikugoensis TaxID=118126 RepID=UPI001FB290AA|nr:hypothetical protein [Methanoculleus chikugoensis]